MPKKKRLGTKAQIRAEKDKERRIASAILLTIILSSVAFSAYFGYTLLNPSQDLGFPEPTLQFKPENLNSELKAAIVDHLSLTTPNRTFVQAAADILTKASYIVDYYSGEKVTAEFYRNLPTRGYQLIVLRVHSTATGPQGEKCPVRLFTSERYSTTKYVHEQLTGQIGWLAFSSEEAKKGILYFGISPFFVTQSMKGTFQNSVIIMMGCEGLTTTSMAEALIEKGAKVYISWNDSVSPNHTDEATAQLLQHLVTESQTIRQAVDNTMKEVGPDPAYNNTLEYYPLESGSYAIQR